MHHPVPSCTRRCGALVLALASTATLVAGCTIPTAQDRQAAAPADSNGSSSSATTTARRPAGQGPATITDQQATALGTAWQRFVDAHPEAQLSMTLLPVGAAAGTAPLELGIGVPLPGAETLRVPIALAAVQKSGGDGSVGGDLITAINANDAAAGQRLWEDLGTPMEAAKLTTQALRVAGDTVTKVSAEEPLKSEWRTVNQVRFTAGLACLPAAEYIRAAMAAANPDLQFGFANLEQAQFASGWAKVEDGTAVRQMAIVDLGAPGFVAVSLSARAQDGSVASAQQLLTEMAQWLMHNVKNVPAGRCP